ALPLARQIADALNAAHDCGIIHRDLKPANIKVRPDGAVKLLDFGVAKALESAASAVVDLTGAATRFDQTEEGVVLGTLAYMAPEQARGQAVDRRADVWAFGVILYEMLTGRRPFRGDTSTDTLASLLKDEPNWSRVPTKIRPLLQLCLEKNPKLRLRDVSSI